MTCHTSFRTAPSRLEMGDFKLLQVETASTDPNPSLHINLTHHAVNVSGAIEMVVCITICPESLPSLSKVPICICCQHHGQPPGNLPTMGMCALTKTPNTTTQEHPVINNPDTNSLSNQFTATHYCQEANSNRSWTLSPSSLPRGLPPQAWV